MSSRGNVLVVDDDPKIGQLLFYNLHQAGFNTDLATTGAEARECLGSHGYSLILLDLMLPDCHGLDLLKEIRDTDPILPVILISAGASISDTVTGIKHGAFDVVEKPFDINILMKLCDRATALYSVKNENRKLRTELAELKAEDKLIGQSAIIEQMRHQMRRLAEVDTTVLVLGETGTGKEVIARLLHELSSRRNEPFVKINCGAIPEHLLESELFGHEKGSFTGAVSAYAGRVQEADGGVLFLDEIADMPANLQVKILALLQDRRYQRIGGRGEIEVDIRIIAATHRDLPVLVGNGSFREDLYYRLNVVPLIVPPLRDRRDDIIGLLLHFLARFCNKMGCEKPRISPDFQEFLLAYKWPGNVRELENLVERLLVTGDGQLWLPRDLPEHFRKKHNSAIQINLIPGVTLAEAEQRVIEQTIAYTGGNKKEAAGILGISEKTIHNKLGRFKGDTVIVN